MARAVILVLALLGLALMGEPRIQFLRAPAFIQPGPTEFNLRIPPDKANRLVTLAAYDQDDGNRVALKERQLEGEQSRSQQLMEILLPRGNLLIVGQLWGVSGELGRASTPVKVRGRFDVPED